MSLDKGIEYGKERRKKYYGSKAVDRTCRPGGDCPHCKQNRTHRYRKQELLIEDMYDEWNDD